MGVFIVDKSALISHGNLIVAKTVITDNRVGVDLAAVAQTNPETQNRPWVYEAVPTYNHAVINEDPWTYPAVPADGHAGPYIGTRAEGNAVSYPAAVPVLKKRFPGGPPGYQCFPQQA
jgi:hypothetical protein